MSINVPSCLLNHAKSLKLSMDISSFSDRQLNNIAKQVLTGGISNGLSATSRLALHIAKKFDSPYVTYSSYRVWYDELAPDHPLFDAVIQACALAKIDGETSSWYRTSIEEAMAEANKRRPEGHIGTYGLPSEAKKLIKNAAKVDVPADHKVRGYIERLRKREFATIDLELRNE
jgi:hypothetical protein